MANLLFVLTSAIFLAVSYGFSVNVLHGDVDGIDFQAPGTFNVNGVGYCGCPSSKPALPSTLQTKLNNYEIDLNAILGCTRGFTGAECSMMDQFPELSVNVIEGQMSDIVKTCDWDADECGNADANGMDDEPEIEALTINFFVAHLCESACFFETNQISFPSNAGPFDLGAFATVFSPFDSVQATLSVDGAFGTLVNGNIDSTSVSFTGTAAAINSWLQTVQFNPASNSAGNMQPLTLTISIPGRPNSSSSKTINIVVPDVTGNDLRITNGQTRTIDVSTTFGTLLCDAGGFLNIPAGVILTVTRATISCTVSGGGLIAVSGVFTCAGGLPGQVRVGPTGTVEVLNTCRLLNGLTCTGTCDINVPSGSTINLGGTFEGARFFIIGVGTITNPTTFANNNRFSGTLDVASQLIISNPGALVAENSLSDINVISGGTLILPNGVWNIDTNVMSGGTLRIDRNGVTIASDSFDCIGGTIVLVADVQAAINSVGARLGVATGTANERNQACAFSGNGVFRILANLAMENLVIDNIDITVPANVRVTMRDVSATNNPEFVVTGTAVILAPFSFTGQGRFRVVRNGAAIVEARARGAAKALVQQQISGVINWVFTADDGSTVTVPTNVIVEFTTTCTLDGTTNIAQNAQVQVSSPTGAGCSIGPNFVGTGQGTFVVNAGGSLAIVGPITFNYAITSAQTSNVLLATAGDVTLTQDPTFLGTVIVGPFTATATNVQTGTESIVFAFTTNRNGKLVVTALTTPATGTPVGFQGQQNFQTTAGTQIEFFQGSFTTNSRLLSATLANIPGIASAVVDLGSTGNASDGTGDLTLAAASTTGSTTGAASVNGGTTGSATGSGNAGTPTSPSAAPTAPAVPATPSDEDDDGSNPVGGIVGGSVGGLLLIIIIVVVIIVVVMKMRSNSGPKYQEPPPGAMPMGAPMAPQPQPVGPMVMGSGITAPATTPVDGPYGGKFYY